MGNVIRKAFLTIPAARDAFDPLKTSVRIALSGDDKIATRLAGGGSVYNSALGVAPLAPGAMIGFQLLEIAAGGGGINQLAIGVAIAPYGALTDSGSLGTDSQSLGLYYTGPNATEIYANNTLLGNGPSAVQGDTIYMEIGAGANLGQLRFKNGIGGTPTTWFTHGLGSTIYFTVCFVNTTGLQVAIV